MELTVLKDVTSAFYLINKQQRRRKTFFIAERSAFLKYSLNKVNWII